MAAGGSRSPTDRPKRSRKSAPKVRTGCLTCKTRHLKCDEGRPICARCRSDGFTCDGYPGASSTATSKSKSCKKALTSQVPSHVTVDISGSALERFYFHHMRQCTVDKLGFSTTDAELWQHIVLPTAHSDNAIKHALVALGMAHMAFLDSPGIETLHGLVLHQYNAAIRELTLGNASTSPDDLQQTLICCLIFYCLDSIMGHYAQSLQHLRAGSKLLGPHLRRAKCAKVTQQSESDRTLRRIADMFAATGVGAGFFLDENLVPDLEYDPLPTSIDDTGLGKPFASLADARRGLNTILVDSNHTFDSHRNDWYAPEMCALFERFRRWATRFDRSTFHFANGSPTHAEQHELVALSMARRLWLTIIYNGDPFPHALTGFDDVFQTILDEAEGLIKPHSSDHYPIFTLQADVVPHVAYVCELTHNPAIQQRAITLLRSMKRREGIWDSEEVAEYLTDYIPARRTFDISWDDIPGGLPGSVRLLSSLNLSNLNSGNNILRLAAERGAEDVNKGPRVFDTIHLLPGYAQKMASIA